MKTHLIGLGLTILLTMLGGPFGAIVGIALWVWLACK